MNPQPPSGREVARRRSLVALGVAALAVACGATSSPGWAQAYPAKPIRLLVGVPPGGATDLVARVVGEQLGRQLGQGVVVDNRAGAAGNIAAELVAKSAPDGYTLFLAPIGTIAINPSLYAKIPFDPLRDFVAIAQLTSLPMAMVVHPSVPATNAREFIQYVRANPGKVNFASGGSGTGTHLAGELFKTLAGIDMVHVPYKGNAPATVDLLAGRVSVMFDQLATALPHMHSGKLRALGVTTAQRSPVAPDVPTLAESGLPRYDATTWHGLVAPAGTPPEIVARLNAAVGRALAAPELVKQFKANGIDPVTGSPEQFTALIESELKRWREVIRVSGAKVE